MNYYLQNQRKLSISNIFILISLLCTLLTTTYPKLMLFGMNNYFLNSGIFHIYIVQYFTYSFIHGGIFHLISNSLFIYIFGNLVELILGKRKFVIFFIFTTIFNGIMLTQLTTGNTVGISGFAMAILTYFTLNLKEKNNPEYKGGITALFLNIVIGFYPGISLVGHFFGVIAGIIFYLYNKNFFKKQFVY